MPRHKSLFRAAVVLLTALLMAGLVRVARFTSLTGYPSYSSLQSGPTGTKLLFQALQQTRKVNLSRDYLPTGDAKFHGAAVLYLGMSADSLRLASDDLLSELERIARSGNRLIIGVLRNESEVKMRETPPIGKRWGIRFLRQGAIASEAANAWHSSPETGALERPFGPGEILLLPNSERLNNENIAKDAKARALVPALIGKNSSIVFEEAQLGVVERGSIAGLARRYHLQGLLAGLLAVVALFIWNRSVPFPPPPALEEEASRVVAGSDTEDMLAYLLSRHIAPESLIDVCIAEWNRRHPAVLLKKSAELLTRSPERRDRGKGDPVAAYLRIQDELRRKKVVTL